MAAAADALPRPGLLVECAGHAAIKEHVVPALATGIPCVVASVGALAEGDPVGVARQHGLHDFGEPHARLFDRLGHRLDGLGRGELRVVGG